MLSKGSYGAWAIIEPPSLYKNVSCAICTFYDREDKGCVATDKIPKVNGYDI